MNDGDVNIPVQVVTWVYIFNSFEYIPRNEIAGSLKASVLSLFLFILALPGSNK